MAVYQFGNAAQLRRLKATCAAHQVLLIDDLAQAFGGRFADESIFGSSGDASIATFGYSKMFDTGDGDTILIDDPSLADTLRILETQIPARLGEAADFAAGHKILCHRIVSLGAPDDRFLDSWFIPGTFPHFVPLPVDSHRCTSGN